MGVSRVRVGDSWVRGRGRSQGVPPSPTNTGGTKTNKHALPPFLLLREKKTTLPPFCFEEQKTQNIAAISAPKGEKDNTAAILFRRTKDSKYRRHFCS